MASGSYNTHAQKEHGAASRVGSELKNLVLGGQDGLVNVFGLIMGVAAGTNDTKTVIIAGLAGTFAESISMAAVAYTSTKAARDYYDSEREHELREMKTIPDMERREVREIFKKKGFHGRLLDSIVKHVTSKKKLWLETMMSDELGLSKNGTDHAGRSALIVGLAAVAGSFVPLLPFFFIHPPSAAIPLVAVISTITLFVAGSAGALLTTGVWWKRGLQMALIGMAAALAGYGIGAWLGVAL